MTKIEFLKYLSKGWFGNSQQHSIQSQLLKARGLNKLPLSCLQTAFKDQLRRI